MKPLITVVIPTYNRAKLIKTPVKSVLNQTYANWELIIVDDGSTDDTEEVLKELLKDERINYYYKKNGGVSSARNLGIKKAKGKYIAFLDSDDEFEKEKLEIQQKEMGSFGSLLSISNSFEVQDEKVEVFSKYKESFLFDNSFFAKNKIPVSGTFFMIKNQKPKFFNEDLPTSEDLDFVMRYLSEGEVLFVNTPLARRYKSFDPVRLSSNPENKIKGLEARLGLFKKNEYSLSGELKELYLSRIYLSLGFWYLFNEKFSKGRKFFKKGFKTKISFKNKIIYKAMYTISFFPPLFRIVKKIGMFLWSRGIIEI